MIKPHHKKIAIIGNSGSGKTTLAFQLQKMLNLPLYHLDQYCWLPNWQRVSREKFYEAHAELCEKDEWIIEGSYINVLYPRVLHADLVIFLDMPRYRCIWYVLKRVVLHFGKVIPGNPENCKQQVFSFKFLAFLKWVWDFKHRHRPTVINILDEFENKKEIYVLKSPKMIRAILQKEEK